MIAENIKQGGLPVRGYTDGFPIHDQKGRLHRVPRRLKTETISAMRSPAPERVKKSCRDLGPTKFFTSSPRRSLPLAGNRGPGPIALPLRTFQAVAIPGNG